MSQSDPRSLSILERLAQGDVLISDGATATYLQSRGLEPGGCPEEMNVSAPNTIKAMAAAYFNAGSDMVLTDSFGGSKFMLKKYGHENKVFEFNHQAAQHAKSVSKAGHFVVGSVGPTGEILESNGGTASQTEVTEAFTEQITALAKGGVEAVNIETMISVQEATLAIRATKENTNLSVISTMMFDKGPRGWHTMMGDTPESAIRTLLDAGADIVGANCGNGIDKMIELADKIRAASDGYVLIHSNAGIPSIVNGQIVYSETPEYMAERFKMLVDMGINIVGGCCGTTPEHIRALTETVRGI